MIKQINRHQFNKNQLIWIEVAPHIWESYRINRRGNQYLYLTRVEPLEDSRKALTRIDMTDPRIRN